MHTIWYLMGLTDPGGWPYLLWSGIFADVVIPAALLGWWKHHNCHTPRCWRMGHPNVTGRVVCRKHHGAKP